MEFTDVRTQVSAATDRTYLNTGTSGPTPRSSWARQVELLTLFNSEGFAAPPVLKAYSRTLDEARKSIADAIGAPSHSVALTHSTSEGIGIIAAGIDWKPGDEVIITELEHSSGIAPWLYLAKEKGVHVVTVPGTGGVVDAAAVAERMTPRTRLICISHVAYGSGAVLPIEQISRMAEERNVWVLVDGAQAAGHVPVDVTALGCHFYALPGQKWLLGPEGTGALYVREDLVEAISPTRVGWASVRDEGPGVFTHAVRSDARRFETGTIHAPAFASLTASIELLTRIGWERLFAHAKALAHSAREQISQLPGIHIVSPSVAPSGLLTFTVEGVHDDQLVARLWSQHRVVVRSVPAPTRGVRASFHVFNNDNDVERLCEAVDESVKSLRRTS